MTEPNTSIISIGGLDKAEVLAALYNRAKVQGMGRFQAKPGDMTRAAAQKILDDGKDRPRQYFDYLFGRVMKVDLTKGFFDPWLYDEDNGDGAAESVIAALRKRQAQVGASPLDGDAPTKEEP